MANKDFKYIIVGAGLAGTSAIEGIRSLDQNGSILLAGQERHLPYNRPPLSKNLWLKKKKVEDIFVHDRQFYVDNKIDVLLNTTVARLDVKTKTIFCDSNSYHYEKLLLVTGGTPRHLNIPGGHLDGIYYYRYLDDYLAIRPLIVDGTKVTVIGSGFIGSEMAAALNVNKADVTMITPESRLVQRIFPKELGEALADKFIQRGVKILSEDKPASITKFNNLIFTHNFVYNYIKDCCLCLQSSLPRGYNSDFDNRKPVFMNFITYKTITCIIS